MISQHFHNIRNFEPDCSLSQIRAIACCTTCSDKNMLVNDIDFSVIIATHEITLKK